MSTFLDWIERVVARVRSLARGVFFRSRVEEEIREELQSHIELRTDDLVRQGLTRREARRRAHREFGHSETHRQRTRASRGLRVLDQLHFSWIDVKLGLRMLVARPGLTLVSVFALALGIPIGLAPLHFSSAIEAPLPEDPDNRVRAIRYWDPATSTVAPPRMSDYEDWLEGASTFEALAAIRTTAYNVAEAEGSAAPARAALVTASLFDVLRSSAALGRTLGPADEVDGATDVVVLGHDIWRTRFGADSSIVGRTVVVGGRRHVVVGVMPEGFYYPTREQLWLPLREAPRDAADPGPPVRVLGRLADGVETEEAHREVTALGPSDPVLDSERGARLRPEVVLQGYAVAGVPRSGVGTMPEFFVTQLVALALLLVACSNVAMLTFARTATRFRELAVRAALGASRTRIVTQIFVETQLLAMLSAGVGLFFVDWLLGRLRSGLTTFELSLPYWLSFGVNGEAVIGAIVLATVSATVAGVGPAVYVTGRGVQEGIRRGPGSRRTIRFGGVTGALIAMDVAVAVTVISFAVGLADYLRFQVGTDELVGIAAEEYLAVDLRRPMIEPAMSASGTDPQRGEIQTLLVERLRAEAEVRGVVVAQALPRMNHPSGMVEVEGVAPPPGRPGRWVRTVQVSVDFLRELDRPLRSGRDFARSDVDAGMTRPVLVNTAFVRDVLGGVDAVGHRLRFVNAGSTQGAEWREIVGVVGHLGMSIADPRDDPGVYLPAAPGEIDPMWLGIHVGPSPERFTPRLREIVTEVDPDLVLGAPRALDRFYPGDWYLMIAVTGGLALLVLVLVAMAASGIYAIVSFSVSERIREIGVRSALGAPRHRLVWTVLRRSLLQVGAGALLGMPVAAFVLGGTMGGPDTAFTPASSAVAVGLGLGLVTVISLCSFTVPMRRMLGIRASDALRAEG